MAAPLRLIVYDATQQQRSPAALGWSWRLGSSLYRGLGRADAAFGARSFAQAFAWLNNYAGDRQIGELQFWGHGKWGKAFIDRESLTRGALSEGHPLHRALLGFRERLAADALLWFRTCETLGAIEGQDFAAALADFSGARVAGHTYVIGFFQSGLHSLAPGSRAKWSSSEGLSRGSAAEPLAALGSHPSQPNTVTCITGQIPPEYCD